MKTLFARAAAHVRVLWPRWPLWPIAPFWLLALFWAVQGKLRWDHIALAVFATALAYATLWTKRLYLGILPIGLVGVLYDTMKVVKNVGLSQDTVRVCEVRAIDQRFFGMDLDGVRVTVHDYLQRHPSDFLDRYCAIPYGTFIVVIVSYSIYLFFRDYPGLLRFTWAFLALNIAGFITYHVYPAAPPWYYHAHGCVVDLTTHASEGPNLARVDAWLGFPYFGGMYGRSSDVFGAIPSLHVAYPLLMVIDGFRRHHWLGRTLSLWFYLSMCFAAVYLDHHWIIDILIGSLYTVIAVVVMRRVFASHAVLELPSMPAPSATTTVESRTR